MKSATKLSLLLVAILASIFTVQLTQAKLFSDKGTCVPNIISGVTTLGQEGDSCGLLSERCALPTECDIYGSKTCKVQQLFPGKDCSTDNDCYAFKSVRTEVGSLKCLGKKCRWVRGLDDSCEVDAQCPLNVPCKKGKCAKERGDVCLWLVDDVTGACGSNMYCRSLTCQPLLDNGKGCVYHGECKSKHCYDRECIAEQKSEGGSCKYNLLLDNCADGMFCNRKTNKCKGYAGVGESCEFTLDDRTKICKAGLLCKDNKCTRPSDVSCSGQSDCGNIFRGVCMCKTGRCAATYDAFTCGAQLIKANACLLTQCRQVLTAYTFADRDSCAHRKCMSELLDWHDCHKVVTKREYSVTESYMGNASVARVSTMLLVVLSVIVSFFSL